MFPGRSSYLATQCYRARTDLSLLWENICCCGWQQFDQWMFDMENSSFLPFALRPTITPSLTMKILWSPPVSVSLSVSVCLCGSWVWVLSQIQETNPHNSRDVRLTVSTSTLCDSSAAQSEVLCLGIFVEILYWNTIKYLELKVPGYITAFFNYKGERFRCIDPKIKTWIE